MPNKKMENDKRKMMEEFWSKRALLYKSDPKANTNDIWLREIEINYVINVIKFHSFNNILDFGCANGYSTIRIAKLYENVKFTGIDINQDMIDIANDSVVKDKLSNIVFKKFNIIEKKLNQKFDLIYTIRVFQNIESPGMQKKVFNEIYKLLNQNGMFLYIESYVDGYRQINEDRVKMGLTPLPIHAHLTLLTDDFDNYISGKMKLLEKSSLSSSYYLITRLLYSYIAKMNNEPIDYNHPIHQVAAIVPQIGEYGPQKASLYIKNKNS